MAHQFRCAVVPAGSADSDPLPFSRDRCPRDQSYSVLDRLHIGCAPETRGGRKMWTESTRGVLVLRLAILAGLTAMLTVNVLSGIGF